MILHHGDVVPYHPVMMLTDHYASILSSTSSPKSLSDLYNTNNGSRVKKDMLRRSSIDVLPKIQGDVVDLDDDDEDDDYETMNPGVSTNNLLSWTEKRGSSESRECSIPRPHNLTSKPLNAKPVKYVSIVLRPDPSEHSSLPSSHPTCASTTTDSTAGYLRGSPVQENSGDDRAVHKRWTRIIPEEGSTMQPITTDPKLTRPHNNRRRRNSTQPNSNWLRVLPNTT